MIKLMSINGMIAIAFIVFGMVIMGLIVLTNRGGNEALFAILGFIGGWLNSIVLFFFRKPPTKKEDSNG